MNVLVQTEVTDQPTRAGRIVACRSCGCSDLPTVLDLGQQPLANALLEPDELCDQEAVFPLEVVFCTSCGLLQVSETIPPSTLFGNDYPYFSSFIPALLEHSRVHAELLMEEFPDLSDGLVVEIASNDGYLLKNFVEKGIPVLGIDPASGPAAAAIAAGVTTQTDFFGVKVAQRLVREHKRASVMLANNVLAHVTDINDFIGGFALLLAEGGIAEFEFPYVRPLIENCAFDTIYHEHVFYYSLAALEPLFLRHGLYLNDAKTLPIHGGSLRLRVSRTAGKSDALELLQAEEFALGIEGLEYYRLFGQRVAALKNDLTAMLRELIAQNKTIVGYGAAAKGATLLNYVKLPTGTVSYLVDRNTHKVGKIMPGVRLAIKDVGALLESQPDYLLILTWNFADEIIAQQQTYHERGGTFLRAVPFPQILP